MPPAKPGQPASSTARQGKTDAGATPPTAKTPPRAPTDDPGTLDIQAEGLVRTDAGPAGPDYAAAPRRERASPRGESDPLPPPPTAAIPGGPLNIPGSKVDLESRRVDRFLDEGGSSMLGRLLDADAGTGVGDAQIEAWMGTRSIHAETETDGRFRFDGLVPGSRITVWLTATTKYVQERIDVTVPPGNANFNSTFKILPRTAASGRAGGIGVFLNRRGGKTVVTGLDAFGPAERAGMQIGDAIVAVGKRQASELGPGAIEYLLRGTVGDEVEVTVAGKSGAPRKLTLRRAGR